MSRIFGCMIVLALLLVTPVFAQDDSAVRIDGSLVMQDMVNALVAGYQTSSELEDLQITVDTNGPNSAFAALCGGGVDVVMSTRFVEDGEACPDFIETLVGFQGVVAVLSPGLPGAVACVGLNDLDRVYGLPAEGTAGDIQLLNQFAEPGALTIYSPNVGTPAYELLRALLPSGQLRADMTFYESPAALGELLREPGIAYLTLADYTALNSTGQMSALEVRNDQTGTCTSPTLGGIETRNYPASRPLLLYTTSQALQKPAVRDLLLYVGSAEGAPSLAAEFDYSAASEANYARSLNNISALVTGRTFSRPAVPVGISNAAVGEVVLMGSPLAADVAGALTANLSFSYPGVVLQQKLNGTAASLEALCGGDAPLAITDQAPTCGGAALYEVPLGVEAVVFAVAAQNESLPACLSYDQLVAAFAAPIADSGEIPAAAEREVARGVQNWSELGGDDLPLLVILPGRSSAALDWLFAEAGAAGRFARSDQEENVLYSPAFGAEPGLYRAAAVANYDGGALTVLSWADYLRSEHQNDLRLLEIGADCVAPSAESIQDGSYPLAARYRLVVAEDVMADQAVAATVWEMFSDDALNALEALNLTGVDRDDLQERREDVFGLLQGALARASAQQAARAQLESLAASVLKPPSSGE